VKKRKVILFILASIILIGGIMGVIKGFVPYMEWLSFRYLLSEDLTFELGQMTIFARVYGVIMGLLEIISAGFIFTQRQRLLLFVAIMLVINILGCIVAICMGDMFAMVSLIIRIVPLYFVLKEYRS